MIPTRRCLISGSQAPGWSATASKTPCPIWCGYVVFRSLPEDWIGFIWIALRQVMPVRQGDGQTLERDGRLWRAADFLAAGATFLAGVRLGM